MNPQISNEMCASHRQCKRVYVGLELNGFLGGLGSGKVQGWLASALWNPIIA